MTYDCFLFYNELDLLEVRLEILSKHVDYFVLAEATQTFTGKDKPLYYQLNRDRFSRFRKQIIHVVIEDDPGFENAWDRETFQRNGIMRGLKQCASEDRILISDLDEIPNPEELSNVTPTTTSRGFQQLLFYYYLNNLNTTTLWWIGTCLIRYDKLLQLTPQKARMQARKNRLELIKNGGWHFSFLGNSEYIADKISNFSHQEFNNNTFNNKENIDKALQSGQDLFGRKYIYKAVPIDYSFPNYLIQNRDKLKELIMPSDVNAPTTSVFISKKRQRAFREMLAKRIEKITRGLT